MDEQEIEKNNNPQTAGDVANEISQAALSDIPSNVETCDTAIADESGQAVLQDDETRAEEKRTVNLVAVGFRTAFSTFVALVLLFGCFLEFFPYTAMRFYTKLDIKDMALFSAEKYMNRNADDYNPEAGVYPSAFGKYADALYCAVNNSVYFMNDKISSDGYGGKKTLKYAAKTEKYADRYLSASTLTERTAIVDAYNMSHSSPTMHPYLYSYRDYLDITRFKARHIIGGSENERMINDYISLATSGWNEGSGEWQVSDGKLSGSVAFSDNQIHDMFLLMAQLSAYIETELDKLGLSDEIAAAEEGILPANSLRGKINLYNRNPFPLFVDKDGKATGLYNDVFYRIDSFVDYLVDNSIRYVPSSDADGNIVSAGNRDAHLKHTYYLKTLTDFTNDMINMTAVYYAGSQYFNPAYSKDMQERYEYWTRKRFLSRDGKDIEVRMTVDGITRMYAGKTLEFWYKWGMLYDYVYRICGMKA